MKSSMLKYSEESCYDYVHLTPILPILKVLESDLEKLKARALEEGMPYQTLLNSVLHKYITGQLVDKGRIA